MSLNLLDSWDKVLSHVRLALGNPRDFKTWIKPIQPVGVDGRRLSIRVPDSMFGDWICDEGYDALILEAVADVTGERFELDILSGPAPRPAPDEGTTGELFDDVDVKEEAVTQPVATAPNTSGSQLIETYVFESFVVGPSNQFAHAASMAVAESPGSTYNPLFLYGGVGLGKTHLLHAIGNEMRRYNSEARVTYLSSESYVNELIDSLRVSRMAEFRDRYRNQSDILLIDDIQFISGKRQTQEEFFHTFNALYNAGKQIVVTSDQPPQDLSGLEERLRSRFQWGLIADIQPPEIETRVAILQTKAQRNNITLPDDVAMFIATNVRTNVRRLEGALIKLAAYTSLKAVSITMDLAKDVLRDILPNYERPLTVDDIIRLAATHFDIKTSDIRGNRRHKVVTLPRQIAMFLARRHTNLSFPEIGARFGGRDHSTVMTSVKKIESLLESDSKVRQAVEVIERQLNI